MPKRDERNSSDDDDNYEEATSDDEEGDMTKRPPKRRRLSGKIDNSVQHYDNKKSPTPSSPDNTYNTSDDEEDSDMEREWDKELDVMSPCQGVKELQGDGDDGDPAGEGDDKKGEYGDQDDGDDADEGGDGDRDGDDSDDDDGDNEATFAKYPAEKVRPDYVRGLSAKESSLSSFFQQNVAERVTSYVKKHLFRVVKFVSNEKMFARAFLEVMEHEEVRDKERVKFQMLYESVFNHALNSKRSTCEQAGKAIMMRELRKFKADGIAMYTIEELQKLRRATTEREIEAFIWFFAKFVECVCGLKQWGVQKTRQLVSQASSSASKHGKVVTVSDEAFALLLFDNYIDKWVSAFEREEGQNTDASMASPTTASGRKARKDREKGKYTAQKTGHCKYGGWSREGMARYNQFYHLVKADRASENAAVMEQSVLDCCIAVKAFERNDNSGEGAPSGLQEAEEEPMEACWDL